ncbi:hypothetical protein E3N88_37487 [Mikania micrantha]|uniref:Chromo domain-containing protein n=1 Tax=Mikania micrantha TaxID=192012 RepID=A0A5N6LRF9_9ASTR|nr:hypothetical protein E3N88_37487 [Mikania micrantha]
MADGTRLKGLDDGFKALQESHKQLQNSHSELRSDLNLISSSLEDQKKVLNKVLVQLSQSLPKQSKSSGIRAILDHRTIMRGTHSVDQLLVHWNGLSPAEATWEDKSILSRSFPGFHLEDKVGVKGEGNVVTQEQQPNSLLRRSERERKPPARLLD